MSIVRSALLLLSAIAFGSTATADPGPCPTGMGLNHVYVVLDAETFAAVQASAFVLDSLAAIDAGLPAFEPPTESSQRLFLRGRTTYLELFRPDNRFGEPVGKIGLALGPDDAGALDCIHRAWLDRLGEGTERRRIDRQTDGDPVPWYEAVYHPSTSLGDHLAVWATGYLPSFLPWLYADHPEAATGTRRADFLAPQFAFDRYVQDLTGVTMTLPHDLREAVADQLEVLGYRRAARADRLVLEGDGWTLTLLDPEQHAAGLHELTFSVRALPHRRTHALGSRSQIHFADEPTPLARWTFR